MLPNQFSGAEMALTERLRMTGAILAEPSLTLQCGRRPSNSYFRTAAIHDI
jgi:hypothetical protein